MENGPIEARNIPASYVTSWWLIFFVLWDDKFTLSGNFSDLQKQGPKFPLHILLMLQEILRGKPTGLDGALKPWYSKYGRFQLLGGSSQLVSG